MFNIVKNRGARVGRLLTIEVAKRSRRDKITQYAEAYGASGLLEDVQHISKNMLQDFRLLALKK